jgi:IclR family acetate operon transcriptional repressor
MPSLTPQTITEPAAVLRELETVRAAGYAVDNLENEPGVRCVAVALPGVVAAAIGVSAPALRFTADEVEAAATALKRAGAEIVDEIARGRS